ncbi:phosphatidylethanolamine-binding protein, partial [Phaeosphaeriaceae sp. PMI808]
ETAQPPNLSSPVWSAGEGGSRFGVVLIVDLDVPRNGTRVQLIHWLASGVLLGGDNSSGPAPLIVPVGQVPYLQPSPPVGDVPHTYTFVLFSQPSNFTIPAKYADLAQNRVFFNTSQFLKDAGLGQALAANYIRVQNLSSTPTTTFPPARPNESVAGNSSAPQPFPGAAQALQVGGTAFWAGLATVVLSGFAAIAL